MPLVVARGSRASGASGGVCARTFASRLSTTWRRRSWSPATVLGVRSASSGRSGSSVLAVSIASATTSSSATGSSVERPALVEVREEEQVLDEDAHPLGLAADALHRALEIVGPAGGAAGEELGVGADGGERRAELVRGVGDEPAELALGGLERA